MTYLTPDEIKVLRIALGLDQTNKVYPSRNKLHPTYAAQYQEAVDSLLLRHYMAKRSRDGESYLAATDAGRVAVLDEPWPRTS